MVRYGIRMLTVSEEKLFWRALPNKTYVHKKRHKRHRNKSVQRANEFYYMP